MTQISRLTIAELRQKIHDSELFDQIELYVESATAPRVVGALGRKAIGLKISRVFASEEDLQPNGVSNHKTRPLETLSYIALAKLVRLVAPKEFENCYLALEIPLEAVEKESKKPKPKAKAEVKTEPEAESKPDEVAEGSNEDAKALLNAKDGWASLLNDQQNLPALKKTWLSMPRQFQQMPDLASIKEKRKSELMAKKEEKNES